MSTVFQTQQLAALNASNGWLTAINEAGKAAFAEAQWPSRKTEAWKYCSLKALADHAFDAAATASTTAEQLAEITQIAGLDAYQLVLVNGQLQAELSSAMALSQVSLFSGADAEQQTLIADRLQQARLQPGHHLFNDLNDAALADGVLVQIGKNSRLDKPLQLVSISTGDNHVVNSRVIVVLETGAELTLIEQFASLANDSSFTNNQTEVLVGDNARFNHYRLNLMESDARFIGTTLVDLQRDANYDSFHLGLGSVLTRNDLIVNHNVGGSHAEIAGVYVPKDSQLVDFHTDIEHRVAHCTSNEVFRGIINDQAKAVFNGRIHIHKDAQKTLAELSNKNLLLTNKAEINTKPELEIYADDVKCAHGATVAQLDNKARFYLQSRGIGEQEAQVMLSFGFINELLDGLKVEAIGDWLRPVLAHRFGRDQVFSAEQTGDL
ncbi:Fe-S cluster assembly protein SufD [Oceanobacter mangrovi]|uniref:Fe-S cluster assembly protein SufD n=1 Tax=Oceanobacter mangrovi TaxID=2862510 RepID=UPI001C8DF1EA|nr:Fe-S cluster assembly protein SufD [Oceanobacter mangrovi]